MRDLSRRGAVGLPTLAIAVCALAAIAALITWTQRLPEGVQPIAWDREACAHCRMHIGEPHFAAQLQLADGRVLSFDDPGCLLRERADHPALSVRAAYVHHVEEDRWVPLDQAGFVERTPTPMGWGLGAVDRVAPGAVSAEEATRRVSRTPDKGGASWR